MKMPLEWLGDAANNRMIDGHAAQTAPVALWACMSSLAGGAAPIARLVERRVDNAATEWRALWLTETLLTYGVAQKGKEGWTAHSQGSGDNQPDALTGWTRSIRAIAKVELVDARCGKQRSLGESGEDWMWSSSARIILGADESVGLPLFGESTGEQSDKDVQAFLNALATRL